jgi:hypothetical protein
MSSSFAKPDQISESPLIGSKTREKLQIIDDYMHERISLEEYLGLVERQATWPAGHIGAGAVQVNALPTFGRLMRFFARSR